MARVFPIQTNFTAGEISPRLYGRVDIERFRNAAQILENVIVLPQGGVVRAPGLRYLAAAKHHDKRAVLVPYVFNEQQAYMLEMGDAYFRFFNAAGQIVYESSPGVFTPVELGSSYAEADLPTIDYVQAKDTMFLFHATYAPARLRRFGDEYWALDTVPWVVEPFDEVGTKPAADLTLSSTAVGASTATASVAAFLASDVGREIEVEGGLAVITAYTSTTVVDVDILTAFPNATVAAGDWRITGTPYTDCTPSAAGPVGATITLTLGAAGWRAEDVGKFVEMNDGRVQITVYTSATVVSGVIAKEMAAAAAAPALAWTLKASIWGGDNGYPRTGTVHEQRLWNGGSPGYPSTFNGSRIAEYLNYELGTLDDDAVSFIADDEKNGTLLHLTRLGRALVMLTSSSVITAQGGNEKPITPTNVQIRPQTGYGASTVQPELVGRELWYVTASRKKLRALSEDSVRYDSYNAPDVSIMSDHIARLGLNGLAWQEEPDPVMYATLDNGQVATVTVDRDQEVVAWTRRITAGEIESVAALPVEGGRQIWAIVKREVDGNVVRYIERFDDEIMTDCAITGIDIAGKAVWAGLEHLEGCEVVVKADGVDMGTFTVSAGEIELPRNAYEVEIGLRYVPRIKTLRPEVFGAMGSSQGANMSVSEVTLRVLETIGATVNGQQIHARQTGLGVLDQPPPAYTGDLKCSEWGWDVGDTPIEITQPQPYPFHLQAIITTLTVNQ